MMNKVKKGKIKKGEREGTYPRLGSSTEGNFAWLRRPLISRAKVGFPGAAQ